MKLYFAGAEPRKFQELLLKLGAKNILISAYVYRYKNFSNLLNSFDNLLVDSGGYTIRRLGLKVDNNAYINYLNNNKVEIAFNLDTNNLQESLENLKLLHEKTRTKILPVYHLSEYLNKKEKNIIDYYISKYDYIALGGVAGVRSRGKLLEEFLSFVFLKTRDKIKIHGLGITSKKLLIKYPFYSVDSTSWQSIIRFGQSSTDIHKRLLKYKTKNLNYMKNLIMEIEYWNKSEEDITRLWDIKGITWK